MVARGADPSSRAAEAPGRASVRGQGISRAAALRDALAASIVRPAPGFQRATTDAERRQHCPLQSGSGSSAPLDVTRDNADPQSTNGTIGITQGAVFSLATLEFGVGAPNSNVIVGHEGLEPSTNGLRIHCSTN